MDSSIWSESNVRTADMHFNDHDKRLSHSSVNKVFTTSESCTIGGSIRLCRIKGYWTLVGGGKDVLVESALSKDQYYRLIGLVGRVFANGPGDLGSIPGRVIPKTLKMVVDTSLLNTQQYKVRIKGKVEQSRERSNHPPYISV